MYIRVYSFKSITIYKIAFYSLTTEWFLPLMTREGDTDYIWKKRCIHYANITVKKKIIKMQVYAVKLIPQALLICHDKCIKLRNIF